MPKRILIADDDAKLRRVVRFLIEAQTPCEVCGEAVDGADAIEKARPLKPDLIILDYRMPLMNGVDVGAILGAMLPHVPVILFTGQESVDVNSAAISAGIRAVVQKADIGMLAGHIEFLLN